MKNKHSPGGYLTVFLTAILALIVSFCLALIEGVRSNAIRLETEIAFETALDAIFSEYHKELFEQYNLFAIDSSYKSDEAGIWKTENRLSDYLQRNLSYQGPRLGFGTKDFLSARVGQLEITGGVCLTDKDGQVFQKCAATALLSEYGVGLIKDVSQWVSVIKEEGLEETMVEEKRKQINLAIDSFSEKKMKENPNADPIESPVKETESFLASGILSMVVQNPSQLSKKGINNAGLLEKRYEKGNVNQGNMQGDISLSVTEKTAFREYLFRYFSRYRKPLKDTVLDYEIEYLIHGGDSDMENLNGVMLRIYGIREGANASYLFSDTTKCNEVGAVATVIATVMGAPELSEAFKTAILLAWASVESVYDVKQLMNGRRVPLLKNSSNWHSDIGSVIGSLFQFGESNVTEGLAYEDYLRIFLAGKEADTLSLRAMNLMEANIRMTPGNSAFRMDSCYVNLQAEATVESAFGYINSIIRNRKYE